MTWNISVCISASKQSCWKNVAVWSSCMCGRENQSCQGTTVPLLAGEKSNLSEADFPKPVGSLLNTWDIQPVSACRKISADSPCQGPLWAELSRIPASRRLTSAALPPAQGALPSDLQVLWWAGSNRQSSACFTSMGDNQKPKAFWRIAVTPCRGGRQTKPHSYLALPPAARGLGQDQAWQTRQAASTTPPCKRALLASLHVYKQAS